MTKQVELKEYPRGSWVRFMSNGKLAIGQVEYINDTNEYYRYHIITDVGAVVLKSVLEIRKPPKEI